MLPESSFQSELTHLKQSILLQDAQLPQEAKDELSLLLEKDYSSIVSKSRMDIGRTNLFQIDIPTTDLPRAHKLYPMPLKYQKFIDEEIQ